MLTEVPVPPARYPTKGWKMVRSRYKLLNRYPNRNRYILRQAAQRAGLNVVGYGLEFPTSWDCPVWFDITAWVVVRGVRQIGIVFLKDKLSGTPGNPYNTMARANRLRYLREMDIPFLEVWPASEDELTARIEMWLMMIGRTHQREAPSTPPKKPKRMARRKDQSLI